MIEQIPHSITQRNCQIKLISRLHTHHWINQSTKPQPHFRIQRLHKREERKEFRRTKDYPNTSSGILTGLKKHSNVSPHLPYNHFPLVPQQFNPRHRHLRHCLAAYTQKNSNKVTVNLKSFFQEIKFRGHREIHHLEELNVLQKRDRPIFTAFLQCLVAALAAVIAS